MKKAKIILFSIVLCTLVYFANAQEIASVHIQYKLTYVIDTTQPESPDIAGLVCKPYNFNQLRDALRKVVEVEKQN